MLIRIFSVVARGRALHAAGDEGRDHVQRILREVVLPNAASSAASATRRRRPPAAEQAAFLVEELVAPVDRAAQRPVPLGQVAGRPGSRSSRVSRRSSRAAGESRRIRAARARSRAAVRRGGAQISATAAAFSSVSAKSGWTAARPLDEQRDGRRCAGARRPVAGLVGQSPAAATSYTLLAADAQHVRLVTRKVTPRARARISADDASARRPRSARSCRARSAPRASSRAGDARASSSAVAVVADAEGVRRSSAAAGPGSSTPSSSTKYTCRPGRGPRLASARPRSRAGSCRSRPGPIRRHDAGIASARAARGRAGDVVLAADRAW